MTRFLNSCINAFYTNKCYIYSETMYNESFHRLFKNKKVNIMIKQCEKDSYLNMLVGGES